MNIFDRRAASPCAIALCLIAGMSSPALADHSAPSGLGGSGASLAVISPDTLEKGGSAAGFRLTVTMPDKRSDDELRALAGQHVHAHDTDFTAIAAVGFAYGLTDTVTLSAELPYVLRNNLRAGEHSHSGGTSHNEVERLGDVAGIGDLSLIAKARVIHADPFKLALIAGVKVPTGSTHRTGDNGERLEVEHQPGTGSWDPLAGAAAALELGTLNLGASVLYQWSGKGALETRLGDRAQGGLSLSRHFGPGEHHDDSGEAPHGHKSWDLFADLTGEWEGRQRIAGEIEADSGGKAIRLSPGARFTSASGWSLAGSVGVPLWQDIRPSHPDNSVRATFAIGRAF